MWVPFFLALLLLIIFAQHVALRFLDVEAIRRMNEPVGSMLASYTPDELKKMLSTTPFVDFRVDGLDGCTSGAGSQHR